MKAIVIHHYGPPEVLSYEEVPDPVPRAGEITIRIFAATVNRILDVALRRGELAGRKPVLPLIPGVDCAGIVEAVGEGVTRWRPGDKVAATGTMPLDPVAEDGSGYDGPKGMMGVKRPGGFAELVAVPAVAAHPVPEALPFHDAAVVMRHCPLAWNLLHGIAGLKPEETVLILGASGNLGSVGIQIAKKVIGARVIAVGGSRERADAGLALGADAAIDASSEDVHEAVMRATDGEGVDVLYDNIANPAVLPAAFRTLRRFGRMVTAGAHGGPDVSLDMGHLYLNKITVRGWTGQQPADRVKSMEAAAAGLIKVQIAHVLPLARAAEAHRIVEADRGSGKIVLDPTLAA